MKYVVKNDILKIFFFVKQKTSLTLMICAGLRRYETNLSLSVEDAWSPSFWKISFVKCYLIFCIDKGMRMIFYTVVGQCLILLFVSVKYSISAKAIIYW